MSEAATFHLVAQTEYFGDARASHTYYTRAGINLLINIDFDVYEKNH